MYPVLFYFPFHAVSNDYFGNRLTREGEDCTYKRETYKRETYKRETYKRETYKRETYKRETYKREIAGT